MKGEVGPKWWIWLRRKWRWGWVGDEVGGCPALWDWFRWKWLGARVPCGCVWVKCVVVGVGFVTSAILTLARLMA